MKKPKDSQKNMFPHSEAKVQLLQKYLEKYFLILSHSLSIKKIYLYDLFCGPGLHENDGIGIPLVILDEIGKILSSNNDKETTFECLFNDLDTEKIESLKTHISYNKHYQNSSNIKFFNEDYNQIIKQVIATANKLKFDEKAFIFIDPYQYKNISFNDIKSLLKTGKAEILLFLPTQFMFRFASNGTPESLINFIEELVPYKEWPQSKTGFNFIENLKLHFKNAIGDRYFVDTFIIKRDAGQYFCLFFFTSNIYGFEKMLETKWEIDKSEGSGWDYEPSGNLFCGTVKSARTLQFENELAKYLMNTPKSNKEVYEFVLHGSHLPKHANDVLRDWQENGSLSVLDSSGNPARKKSFYLAYEHWQKNPAKVTMELK